MQRKGIMNTCALLLLLLFFLLLQPHFIGTARAVGKFSIVSVSPEELHPSEIETVRITLKNIGNRSAYRVSAEVLVKDLERAGSPVKVLGKARKSVGEPPFYAVGTDSEETVEFDFFVEREAMPTVYQIPLCVNWSDDFDETAEHSDILYFGLRVSGIAASAEIDILNVSTVPEVLRPGETGKIRVEMRNVGATRIRTLKAVLHTEGTPFTPLNADLEEYFYEISPGEDFVAEFDVAIGRSADEADRIYYELPLFIEYSDDFASYAKNTSIGVEVRGSPNVLIQEIIVEPSQLTAGTEGLFMLTLINTGTLSAEDVKVRIAGGDDLLTESHQFVGEIAPGETQTTSFGIKVGEDAEIGKHALNIFISYEDKFGKSYSASKIYEISVYPAEPLIPPEYIYAGIGILALAFIGYIIIMRMESGRKEGEKGEAGEERGEK